MIMAESANVASSDNESTPGFEDNISSEDPAAFMKKKGIPDKDIKELTDHGIRTTSSLRLTEQDLNNLKLTKCGRRLLIREFCVKAPSPAVSESNTSGNQSDQQPRTRADQPPRQNRRPVQLGEDETDFDFTDNSGSAVSTLKELMVQTGAKDEDLDRTIPNAHLDIIALKFSNFVALARALKLKNYHITDMETNSHLDYGMKLKEVLHKWKRCFITRAKYRFLANLCLTTLGYGDVAEKICELSKERVVDDDPIDNDRHQNRASYSPLCICVCVCMIAVTLVAVVCGLIYVSRTPSVEPLDMAPLPPVSTRSTHSTTPPTASHSSTKNAAIIIQPGDRPKMTQLRSFKLSDGTKIDFVKVIGASYRDFGIHLLDLNDTDNIEQGCHHQPKCIVDRMLGDWLNGKGRLPVTWATLVDVLEEAELMVLVRDVRGQYHSERVEL